MWATMVTTDDELKGSDRSHLDTQVCARTEGEGGDKRHVTAIGRRRLRDTVKNGLVDGVMFSIFHDVICPKLAQDGTEVLSDRFGIDIKGLSKCSQIARIHVSKYLR